MSKRKRTPPEIETEVFIKSARKCCLCFGLEANFAEQRGQIAHLDGDPSKYDFENLAWLCLRHHDQYDSKTRQSKGLSIHEIKRYRTALYQEVDQWRLRLSMPIPSVDVPFLSFHEEVLSGDMPLKGIQFTDKAPNGSDGHPALYLSVYFKNSRYFGKYLPPSTQKWLYLQANIRPAFTVSIQVCASNQRDVDELMGVLTDYQGKYLPGWLSGLGDESVKQFLQGKSQGWDLHGPIPDNREHGAGDYLRIWPEEGVKRLVMSTFTPTNASISLDVRFSSGAAKALAEYLESVGFTKFSD